MLFGCKSIFFSLETLVFKNFEKKSKEWKKGEAARREFWKVFKVLCDFEKKKNIYFRVAKTQLLHGVKSFGRFVFEHMGLSV